ncbi:hypothetical protein IJH74_00770 [Candidatus Saccharibacteria bacterium]|nr:hypothetical protein [Candidatus Saccharibacteria bacterium]
MYIRDDAGNSYSVTGNDRAAYESMISQIQAAKASGRSFDFNSSNNIGFKMDMERYEAGITDSDGRLGKTFW